MLEATLIVSVSLNVVLTLLSYFKERTLHEAYKTYDTKLENNRNKYDARIDELQQLVRLRGDEERKFQMDIQRQHSNAAAKAIVKGAVSDAYEGDTGWNDGLSVKKDDLYAILEQVKRDGSL